MPRTRGSRAMSALRLVPRQASSTSDGIPRRSPRSAQAARSRIWSPTAHPIRAGRAPPRRKTPRGRFWTGKSVSGSFADSIQLRSDASCVPSIFGITGCPAESGWLSGRAPRASAGRPPARRRSRSRSDVAKSRRAFATSSAETWRWRQARPSSSRRKAEASCSRSTASMSASGAPARAKAAAAKTFRKPCITARGLPGS